MLCCPSLRARAMCGGTSIAEGFVNIVRQSTVIAALSLCFAAPAFAAVIGPGVVKIADTSTAMPGGGGNFQVFGADGNGVGYGPTIDGSNVVFAATSAGSFPTNTRGVYGYINNSLTLIANNNTPMPGATGNFIWLSALSIDGSSIAVRGHNPSRDGVYLFDSGSPSIVLDTATPGPSGGTINGFGAGVVGPGPVTNIFATANNGTQGIYRRAPGGPFT